ncbi:hypothetical protein HU200_052913 [Digitaria exilis]|uniref:Small auxin up regulated protein n=1 Tax=Digitaria exilis TaxID=1010633 RepID=A0A835AHZ5_9POAL|nr:hypothetical protein HU200_052913 [Digitaria exilis]
MENKAPEKKGFLAKAIRQCRHLGRRRSPVAAPPGSFPVLVGPERERFVVRVESANHRLFMELLDEAEAEYGFPRTAAAAGEPLVLPCAAEKFRRVMAEVVRDGDEEEEEEDDEVVVANGGVAVDVDGSSAHRSPAWMFLAKWSGSKGYVKMMSPARRRRGAS